MTGQDLRLIRVGGRVKQVELARALSMWQPDLSFIERSPKNVSDEFAHRYICVVRELVRQSWAAVRGVALVP